MAWVTPSNRSTSDMITAAIWNQDVVANMIALKSGVAAHFVLTAGMWTSITAGCGESVKIESGITFLALPFTNGIVSYAECCFPLPSDYDGGTITAKFYWTANSTSTGAVYWGLEASSLADGSALSTVMGTAQYVADANGSSAYTCRISAATSALTISNSPAAGDLVCWRVSRYGSSGSDTLAEVADLIAVLLTYTRT